jgi:hypothetical protein
MANLSPYPSGKILREPGRQGLLKLGYRSVTLLLPAALLTGLGAPVFRVRKVLFL